MKRLDHETENIADTILACFMLHNLTQTEEEFFIDYYNIVGEVIRKKRAARQRRKFAIIFALQVKG